MTRRAAGIRASLRPAAPLAGYELPDGAVLIAFDVDGTAALAAASATLAALTPGQRRIVSEALGGKSDAEIARRLRVSRHTVSNQLRRAYARLGVSTRVELCALLRG